MLAQHVHVIDGFAVRRLKPEPVEGLNEFLWVGEDGDWVGFEAGTGSLAGFELAVEEEGGIGEFFSREAEGGAKEDLGRPAPGKPPIAPVPAVIPILRAPDDPGIDDEAPIDEFTEKIGTPRAQAGGWRGFWSRWGS